LPYCIVYFILRWTDHARMLQKISLGRLEKTSKILFRPNLLKFLINVKLRGGAFLKHN